MTLLAVKLPSGLVPVLLLLSCPLCLTRFAANSCSAGRPGGAPPHISCRGKSRILIFWFSCVLFCLEEEAHTGCLNQRHRLGEASNMLLVCANSAKVRAERKM